MKIDAIVERPWFACSLLALIPLFASPALATAQDVPPCDSAKVQYSPVEDKYLEKIKVQGVTELQVPDNVEKQFSPQRTFWLFAVPPNYQKDGPWTTTVFIKSADGNTMRKITFLDHGTGGVKLEWLNERLLFARVWWGRILSTDFILDVQNREFLYQQNAYYGQLMESCK
jgi:hypothetical protein